MQTVFTIQQTTTKQITVPSWCHSPRIVERDVYRMTNEAWNNTIRLKNEFCLSTLTTLGPKGDWPSSSRKRCLVAAELTAPVENAIARKNRFRFIGEEEGTSETTTILSGWLKQRGWRTECFGLRTVIFRGDNSPFACDPVNSLSVRSLVVFLWTFVQ